jgi:hypothetical protein
MREGGKKEGRTRRDDEKGGSGRVRRAIRLVNTDGGERD